MSASLPSAEHADGRGHKARAQQPQAVAAHFAPDGTEHSGGQAHEVPVREHHHPHAAAPTATRHAAPSAVQRVEFEREVTPMANTSAPVRRYRGDTVVERPQLRAAALPSVVHGAAAAAPRTSAATETASPRSATSPLAESIDSRWVGVDDEAIALTIPPEVLEEAAASADERAERAAGGSAAAITSQPSAEHADGRGHKARAQQPQAVAAHFAPDGTEHSGGQAHEVPVREHHPQAVQVVPRGALRVEFEREEAPIRADASVPVRRYRGDTVVERPQPR
jgi:hypothetical protein